MKAQEIVRVKNPGMRVENIRLTRRAKDLIERKVVARRPREYTAEDLVEIVDRNDAAIAKGNFKTWPEVLAGVSEEYGLSI